MKLTSGRYSIVSILLLTAVVALSMSLYQTNRSLRSASESLSSAWQNRWPDPNQLNVLLTSEAMEIVDYENHSTSASWQALVPVKGSFCIRWKAGPDPQPKSAVLPGGFSRIDLKISESAGTQAELEIAIDGVKTYDQLDILSPLIVDPVVFSVAGMGRTQSHPPTDCFQLFFLRADDGHPQDAVEIWIEPIASPATRQKSAADANVDRPAQDT